MRRLPPILVAVIAVAAVVAGGCAGEDGPGLVAATTIPTAAPTGAAQVTPTAVPDPTADPAGEQLPPPLDIEPPEYFSVAVVDVHPHDPEAFTQGLIIDDGRMFESTGAVGPLGSVVREVDPLTGEVLDETALEGVFGEGLELVGDRLYMLTWQDQTMFVIDSETLEILSQVTYEGEGWGLCLLDEETLAMSDGSSTIDFRSADDFSVLDSVEVSLEGGEPVSLINELECVDGVIWANVWSSDEIIRIDPDTGFVTGVVDTAALDRSDVPDDRDAVLNGIAYDEASGTWFVTGKLWPSMFQVRFVPVL